MTEQTDQPVEIEKRVSIRTWGFWGCLGAVGILCILFPGDVSFINDEPELINRALTANAEGRLVKLGLPGTAGIRYGPIPIWYYQLNLLFLNDLVLMSLVKNVLGMVFLGGVLVALTRVSRLNRWCVFLCFLSPYVYLVNRVLWDDCFMIALVGLLAIAFICFCRNGRLRWFVIGNIVCALLVYIQIKAVFSIIPFYVCLLMFEWRRLLKMRWAIVLVLAVAAAVVMPYAAYTMKNLNLTEGTKTGLSVAMFDGLAGARFFSFWGFLEQYLPEFYTSRHAFNPILSKSLVFVSSTIAIPFLVGIFVCIRRLAMKVTKARRLSVYDKVAVLASFTILIQLTFQLLTRKPFHYQYYYGVWFAFFFFVWYAITRFWQYWLVKAWFFAHVTIMLTLLVGFISFVHINGGGRYFAYTSTLSNQIEVVRSIRQSSPRSRVLIRVQDLIAFPHRYLLLHRMEELKAPWMDSPREKPVDWVIDYEEPAECNTGWIMAKRITPTTQRKNSERSSK